MVNINININVHHFDSYLFEACLIEKSFAATKYKTLSFSNFTEPVVAIFL